MVRFKRVDALKHAEVLYALQAKCLPEDDAEGVENGAWWIGYDDEQPVAFCSIRPSRLTGPDGGYLSRAGVIPSHRGYGLQKRMIRIRLRYARRQGWNWVVTDTRHNPPSSNSLIGCGFRVFSPPAPWGHNDAIYWRKSLTEG